MFFKKNAALPLDSRKLPKTGFEGVQILCNLTTSSLRQKSVTAQSISTPLERAPFSEKINVLSFPVLGNATIYVRSRYILYKFCAKV